MEMTKMDLPSPASGMHALKLSPPLSPPTNFKAQIMPVYAEISVAEMADFAKEIQSQAVTKVENDKGLVACATAMNSKKEIQFEGPQKLKNLEGPISSGADSEKTMQSQNFAWGPGSQPCAISETEILPRKGCNMVKGTAPFVSCPSPWFLGNGMVSEQSTTQKIEYFWSSTVILLDLNFQGRWLMAIVGDPLHQ